MPDQYYSNKLYPFQDRVLRAIAKADVGFYLTGGTALSRFYLQHRYSDDLDMFLNQVDDFRDQANTVIDCFKKEAWELEVPVSSERFLRIFLHQENISLKVDFVNDIAYRYGDVIEKDLFPRIDNWRNILSNKLCALSRLEPKDYVDIALIAGKYSFIWEDVVSEARQKNVWVDPISIAKLLSEISENAFSLIKWTKKVEAQFLLDRLKTISKDILMGNRNSVYKK